MTLVVEIAALAARMAESSAVLPLQRCVRTEQAAITAILARGVTTARLAAALAAAGVTQKSGVPLTHGHFRQMVMRMREEAPPYDAPASRPGHATPRRGRGGTRNAIAAPGSSPATSALDLFRHEARRTREEEANRARRPDFSNGLWAP